MKLTQEQERKVLEAIRDTEIALNKELSYQLHLQDNDRLDFLKGHIEKLKGML